MALYRAHFFGLLLLLVIAGSLTIYSYKRCGWGMLAYDNAFMAALTGECAQQIKQQLREEMKLNEENAAREAP